MRARNRFNVPAWRERGNLLRSCLLLPLVVLATSAAPAATCLEHETELDGEIANLQFVADDLGPFRSIGDKALDAVRQCPGSARLWYLAARSAEVLELPMAGKAFASSGGLTVILHNAVLHEPASAPIATVAARLDGGVAAARKAVALDPAYIPARRALALALARHGNLAEAVELSTIKYPVAPDHLTRARVLLLAGRAKEAAAEARLALSPDGRDPVEPTPSIDMQREANEVLGFACLKEGQRTQAQQALRIAAGAGSPAAQHQLASSR